MLAAAHDASRPSAGRRLRVGIDAHTVGRRATGNERYVLELATALARRDDVDVVAFVDRGVTWPPSLQPAPGLTQLRARAPQLRIPFELPIRARRERLDILQVTYVAPPLAGVPVVTAVHDLSFEDHPEFFPLPTRLRLRTLTRLSARRSAAVICISRFTRQRLIDAYGLSPERVHLVPVGVGPQWRPMARAEADRALAALGLTADRPFIAAVGTAHPRKNLARVIEAAALARAIDPQLQLVLCGPLDRTQRQIAAAITAAAGEGWVRTPGYVSDDTLRALYSAAAAVVYASLYEGFGLPVLEALACGAIVVASSTTAVAEAAGDAAVAVDPADAASIALGIERALGDESLRAALRARAEAHLAQFDWDIAAERTVAVYRDALAPHHSAARSR